MTFERVYTIWDYYDGPRSGLADYRGRPHYYECSWNDAADDWNESYLLTPVESETLTLALEQWGIWRQWEHAHQRGEASSDTHPALSGQDSRYHELEAILKSRIDATSAASLRARGIFQPRPDQAELPKGVIVELEVEWSDAT
jgi:hypothetical protein